MTKKQKKTFEPDDKEQSARFIETMERIGLKENAEETLKEAFKKIAKASHHKKNDSGKEN
jgi:ribosomal protein S7